MNNAILLPFLVISIFCAPVVWANTGSLCYSGENILFTCSVGRRLASVCSSKELSRTSGYVQYRFGLRNRVPELLYPTEKIHPASRFSFGSNGGAKWSLYNLHFTLSGHSYTIYQYSAAFDEEGSGIRVKTPDGKFSHLRCKENSLPVNLHILEDLGLRELPFEALVSSDSVETWPAESPNTDLLQGVKTHDFALVSRALANGADVNFHPQDAIGVLGSLADERSQAIRQNRVTEFDEETDRLLALLLSRGASPTISTQNGGTAIDSLANNAPYQTVRKLLDIGWPNDYQYRLYVGALLGNRELVQEALGHGANPNAKIRGGRYLNVALTQACLQAGEERTNRGDQTLAVLELLLRSGATIDEGKGREGGGDIITTYAYWGKHPNMRPIFELLIQYASPNACSNALSYFRLWAPRAQHSVRRELSAWLLKRLEHECRRKDKEG